MGSDNPEQSTTGLNGHFIHSLLLIDVLLRMEPVKNDKDELIALCKKEYKGNKTKLDILREFQEEYAPENALWWYTRDSFLYKMLNKALRVQNIDILFLFRFFIRDVHRELERNQCQSPVRVYRGQVLSNDELKNLQQSVGQFISINSFFSSSTNRYQALGFLNSSEITDDLHRVLSKIDADPRVVTTKPFANISSNSDFPDESEVLFMVGSIFRVVGIHRNNNQIWIIPLTFGSDDEHDLRNLFEYMKKTYGGGDSGVTLLTFGKVLHRMGKFDLAENFYPRLLNELPPTEPSRSDLYYSLGLVLKDKNDLDTSPEYLQKSLKMKMRTSLSDYINISDRYNEIGNIHRRKDDHNTALSWYNKGIELYTKEGATDHPNMAQFYNNIALVYKMQRQYMETVNFTKKALAIREKHLPPNHPDLGLSHNNIGIIHRCLGHYDLALEHYDRSLKIGLESLPPHHSGIAKSYINIGLIHEYKGDLNQALIYFQKAATILRHSLSSEHPDVIEVEENIKRITFET